MNYYVSKNVGSVENGTKDFPFSTIQKAASIAAPGDTIWIGKGIYREWVCPKRGGSDEDHRIIYTNMPGEKAVISGAEEIKNWVHQGDDIWKATISKEVFEAYNPYEDEIFGDWFDGFGQVHHTGEIFMDDVALYEAPDLEHIKQEDKPEREFSWFAAVTEKGTEVWVYLPGLDPNEHKMEASVRPYGFFPENEGLNYITVSGLTVEKVATQWAPPTAFQPGAIGTHWSKGWIIENCVICNSKCSGISIGKRRDEKDNIWSIDPSKGGAQTYTEIVLTNLRKDWSRKNIGSHVIRNNEIYDCGQTGIVGCMGCVFSDITGNHIHHINIRKEFGGAEMAGIKLHCAIDVLLKGNLIHDCIRGMWLDWEAQGTRVSGNAFFNNVEEDLFIEVCHGPCTVENNLLLSESSLLNVSQGTAFVHNLFAGKTKIFPEPGRFTLYHFPHDTFVAGCMIIYGGDDKICNNIYVGGDVGNMDVMLYDREARQACGNIVYNGYPDITDSRISTSKDDRPMSYTDSALPVYIRKNLYFNGAKRYENEAGAVEEKDFEVRLQVVRQGEEYYLETNLSEYGVEPEFDLITSDMLGKSFESEAAYENADGTPFALKEDFVGEIRGEKTIAGPFSELPSRILLNPVR